MCNDIAYTRYYIVCNDIAYTSVGVTLCVMI